MKKRGYPPRVRRSVRGGRLHRGSDPAARHERAAFIIASWTSTPYIKIALIGVAPALLYYFGISLSIYIKAIKLGDKKNEDDALPHFKKAFLEFVIYIIPLIVLVVFLVQDVFPAGLPLLRDPRAAARRADPAGARERACRLRPRVRPQDARRLAIGSKSMAMIAVVMAIMAWSSRS